jgi:arylsulfatase A-like enzyme
MGNNPPDGGFQKFYSEGLEEETIALRLQQSGYRTALFGKYLNLFPGGTVRPTYVPPGWDEWYAKHNGNKMYDYNIMENGKVVPYGGKTEDYYTDVLSGQVVDFIRREAADSKPFFMYVAPTAPHMPAEPAERHKDAFADEKVPRTPSFSEEDLSDKPSWIRNKPSLFAHPIFSATIAGIEELRSTQNYRQRLRSMLAVDDMVASLVQELKDVGKLDDTFIIFTSDNGWLQGEHRIPAGKVLPYEESIRVPLFVRGPGVPAGSKVDKMVLNTDFASTFADLAGEPYPFDGPVDGRSFAALLRGEEPTWRSSILLESPEKGDQQEEDQEEDTHTSAPYEAVRTGTYKYVEYADGERELYDLEADPYELDNIYGSADSSLLGDLKAKLDALRSCAGAGCREAED